MNEKSIALVILGLVAIIAVVGLVLLFKEMSPTGNFARTVEAYQGAFGGFSQAGQPSPVKNGGCTQICSQQYTDQTDPAYSDCLNNCMKTIKGRTYSLGQQMVGTA